MNSALDLWLQRTALFVMVAVALALFVSGLALYAAPAPTHHSPTPLSTRAETLK